LDVRHIRLNVRFNGLKRGNVLFKRFQN